MPILLQIDAFTDRPFAGNPAAVCLLEREPRSPWAQRLAAEMNLSETAFVWPWKDDYGLRWFTPETEVDLCGHATLASAHALWEEGIVSVDTDARFHTRSGLLTARRRGEAIEMDFPAEPPEQAPAPEGLLEALGVEALWVGRNRMDFLVEVDSEATLRGIVPHFRRISETGARGVIVTCRGSGDIDFVSRFFAPAVGVDEDPVTGSAHCCLAPFWAQRLGRNELEGFQASLRGGRVGTTVHGDRVLLRGEAVTVLRGELHELALPPAAAVPAHG